MRIKLADFSPGEIVVTPGAEEALAQAGVKPMELVGRHLAGDWGDVNDEARAENERALLTGAQTLRSSYLLPSGVTVWVITEWDRSATTLLLRKEY